MKQPKKLTYRQRMFLEEKGIKDTVNIRYCKEDKGNYIFLNIKSGEYLSYPMK